jgi:hypothetical protein
MGGRLMDGEAMQARRAAMFNNAYSVQEYRPANRNGPGHNGKTLTLRDCNECGVPVANMDAHFGWHLKIDNIDQRANAQGHHH